MDVVARAVAFVEMLVAAEVQKIEFIDKAVALEQVESAVNGDTMNAGIDFLRAFEDGAGVEVAFRVVHYFEQDFSLAREAYAALFQSGLEAAGALVRVDAFAGGDSMCGCGGHVYWFIRRRNRGILFNGWTQDGKLRIRIFRDLIPLPDRKTRTLHKNREECGTQ
jgi:hypothetical protein